MVHFHIFAGFENIYLMIKQNQSSLACRDTKHRTQNSKRFHSITGSPLCTLYEWPHLCVPSMNDLTFVYPLWMTSPLCTLYEWPHLCVPSMNDLTFVYPLWMTSPLCTLYEWPHLCVPSMNDLTFVYPLWMTSPLCTLYEWPDVLT